MDKAFRLRLALILVLLILAFNLGLVLGRVSKPIPTLQSGSRLREDVGTTKLPTEIDTSNHKVTRVIDGDTIVIDTGEHVRYLGMNAPEIGQLWSWEAKKENGNLVLGQTVRLEFDSVKKDKYARLLAYVWVDNTLVNEKLLAEGLAKILIFNNEPPLKYESRLRVAEISAQKAAQGLWAKKEDQSSLK